MGIVEQYLLQLKTEKRRLQRTAAVLTVLSLLVATGVSWNLRMTGVTLANDACCGYEEHQHTDECLVKNIVCGYDEEVLITEETDLSDAEPVSDTGENTEIVTDTLDDAISDSPPEASEPPHIHVDECYQIEYRCGYEEHFHTLACYSDLKADVETPLDWQEMFEDYPYTGNLCKDLVGIAKTQVGYTESALNFEVVNNELRHGYTRYGAWYGAPYNEWSAMFVSFCLHYAGANLSEYPINSGANTMAGLWDAQGRYTQAGTYFPAAGDLVFFKNNTVGIVTDVQSATMYVICGDIQDSVSGSIMSVSDSLIAGWGMINKTCADPVIDDPDMDDPGMDDSDMDDPGMDDSDMDDPGMDDPGMDDPGMDDPGMDDPGMDDPGMDEPGMDDPGVDDPGMDDPDMDDPGVDDPGMDDSDMDDPGVDDPGGMDDPGMDEPDMDDPGMDDPGMDDPGMDDPGMDDPGMDDYGMDDPGMDDPGVDDPGMDEPDMDDFIVINLAEYLSKNGGTYYYTLTNAKNEDLDPDDDKHYDVNPNESYKLVISIDSPNGIESGVYELKLPSGLLYDDGTGEIILKNNSDESQWVPVGTWTVTEDGVVTIVFNEEMDSLTENVINATIGIHFPDQNESIDFDGKITVTVQPPIEQLYPTEILKGGHQGVEANGEDPTKIYWSIKIIGNKDSQIVGNLLTDSIVVGEWSEEHHYTESDIARGIHFGVSENGRWHDWDVSPNDPNLTWTETGWSYKIPETAICDYCGEIALGDEGWTYYVSYTSTPDTIITAGEYGYENIAGIDGKNYYGWADFTQGDSYGVISKSGTFVSDAGSGKFVWEIQATIPGRARDKKADYYWYLTDYLSMYNNQNSYYVHNDANLSEVTAHYQGATVRVPHLSDATGNDMFAWYVTWSSTDGNGVEYGREIVLLCRCHCNENSCPFWNGSCGGKFWGSNEFCHCWTAEEDVTFTFTYKTDALPLIEEYGGQGYMLKNIVQLYYKPDLIRPTKADDAAAEQEIPGVFKKDITKDFDGFIAHYQITVNEAKAVLTNGDPLIIKDTMSDTLAYISGSLVIKSEDADGNLTELQQGEHYTVSYDGSGSLHDKNGNEVHVLQITILTPQPVKYILDYDTTVLKPDTITGAVKYSNSATITLWGEQIKSDTVEKITGEFNTAAKYYSVKLHKTCALTKQPLAGAVFGIYNEDGGLITTGETENDGYLIIETNLKEGIVLREHVLYYAQEHKPPEAYMLDDTEQWFIFCNSSAEICDTCRARMGDKNAVRIPLGQIGNMDIVNDPISYELPATGGTGFTLYLLCGLVLTSAPLVYGLSLKRKYERRLRK